MRRYGIAIIVLAAAVLLGACIQEAGDRRQEAGETMTQEAGDRRQETGETTMRGTTGDDRTTAVAVQMQIQPGSAKTFAGYRSPTDKYNLFLTAERKAYPPDETLVEVQWDNSAGGSECTFGRQYFLQRWDGERWVDIPASTDFFWADDQLIQSPGQVRSFVYDISWFPRVEGVYRLHVPIVYELYPGAPVSQNRSANAVFEITKNGEPALEQLNPRMFLTLL
ncbi:MAG: hypothetical protein LBG83_07425 [Oscillospiraceae bacterium]|jgi:hypothetical protein|nr:hypothetical protein [Oscillospiraceae bacterium]